MEERRRLEREINSKLSGLDSDYKELLRRVKNDEEQRTKQDKKFQQALTNLHSDISQRDKDKSNEATEYLRNAQNVLREIDNKPHEKFLPGRFDIFANTLKDGRQLFRAGLFEAAVAVGLSVKSGLERLGYDIDDKVNEWEKNFALFSTKLESLREKLNHEISERGKEINSNIRNDVINDIDFWSRGEFVEVVELVKKYREILKACSQLGKEEFIKRTDSPSTDELKKFVDEIDSADKKFSGLSVIYKARYLAACERSDMGEKVIDFMAGEINLMWLENLTGFHDNDFREWLKIVFVNSSGDYICVYIVPVESDKSVDNHVILHVDYNGAENEMYSHDIYRHVCEALNISEINYVHDTEELRANSNKSYRETGRDIEQLRREK